jgi:UDP-glucose 4-epimerase
MFQELYGVLPTILRASNPYGPRQGHLGVQGAIATFLDRLRTGEPIHVWGDGSVVRDYLYVGDLAILCVLAGESTKAGTYNAGSGTGCSLNAVLDVIAEVTGERPEVHFKPSRALDVDRIVLDTSLTEGVFGWRPQVGLRDGIAKHWAWMRSSTSSAGP